MDFLFPISRYLVAPLWAKWEGTPYLKNYRKLLRSQFASREQQEERVVESTRALLEYASERTVFWKERLRRSDFSADSLRSMEDLQRIPPLTKQTLRRRQRDLLSSDYDLETLHRHTTSGSTGVSLETFRDEASQQWKRACTLRSDEWSGWRLGEKKAAVWGNPKYRTDWKGRLRRFLLERDVGTLDTLDMSEDDMHRFADLLEKSRPTLLFGHAHSIFLFADFVKKCRTKSPCRFKGIISSSMMLYHWQRKLIEEVFDCKVTNRYGCEEVSLIACECEKHEGLHVNLDGVFVELVDEDGSPVGQDVPGRILVTDLVNRAMPMIRYEVGDLASWSPRPCSCGRSLPLLKNIEGRVADYVLTPSGRYISGISLTENFALKIKGIGQCQVIQETIDHLEFNIVRDEYFDEQSERAIHEKVRELFGQEVNYDCRFVERIPQEPSGKYRFCISKVIGKVGMGEDESS